MSTVFLALQDVDEARPIVEAIRKDNPDAKFDHQPAMIRITADQELIIKRETVSNEIGADWDPQDIQLTLISFGGHVDEDDDYFRIFWQD